VAQRRLQPCEVQGCDKTRHYLSRYCSRHHTHSLRWGSATQKPVLRKHTLPTEQQIVKPLLFANRFHPAVKLVVRRINDLLKLAARVAPREKPKPHDWQSRAWRELARLRAKGVTGYEVFRIVAGLWFYARSHPDVLEPNSRGHQFTVARHVLNFVERERYGGWCNWSHAVATYTGWRDRKGSVKLPARVLAHVGRQLTVMTIATLQRMEDAYDRQLLQPTPPQPPRPQPQQLKKVTHSHVH